MSSHPPTTSPAADAARLPAAFASLSLSGKVCFVTGGSSGIGAETAKLMAARGAKVAIAARRVDEMEAVVRDIQQATGGEAISIQMDVTKEDDIRRAIDATVAHFGRIDIAFNNSGIPGPRVRAHEVQSADVDSVIAVNWKGIELCMKYELAVMLKQIKDDQQPHIDSFDQTLQPNSYHKQATRHSIINSSSVTGFTAGPNMSPYSASKHAVLGLTRSAAVEYAKDGIRVNACNFGFVTTTKALDTGLSVENRKRMIACGRLGQMVEAAELVCWLASDASSFVMGQDITVDGGSTACAIDF